MRRHYFSDVFNEFFNACNGGCQTDCQRSDCSQLSISEDETSLYIDVPMAGVKSNETDVTLDPKKRSLIIRGEGKLGRENVKYHLKGSHNYYYDIPLSNSIDMEGKVDAVSKDGILSITLPKNKGHKPLKIDVKVV